MFLIDTHTHLYDSSFTEDIDAVVQAALDAGVRYMLMPNCDITTLDSMNALSDKYPDHCFSMLGLHPCYVGRDYKTQLARILDYQNSNSYVAIGEIGLDYYWDKTYIEEQKSAFDIQIGWAYERQLPVVIHTRDSIDDGVSMIAERQNGDLTGVFHCFSGDDRQAQEIIDTGFKLGIGGVVTFKNSNLKDVLRNVPLEHIIIETDAPYLAPVPFRGKRNEPSYVKIIAEYLSQIYEMPVEDIARQTTQNALALFKIN